MRYSECQSAIRQVLFVLVIASAGCAGPAPPASTVHESPERIYLDALPSRTIFIWTDSDDSPSPRQVLGRFVSGMDPSVVLENGDSEIRIRGLYDTSPDEILLRWREEWKCGSDGLLVEATSVHGRPQEGATDLIVGLRAWVSVHGARWAEGPPSGVRAFPRLAAFPQFWEAAGVVFGELGLVHEGVAEEAVGAAWNIYGRSGEGADWILYDAFDSDPRFATEMAVCCPSIPFAGDHERDVLAKILLRLLPTEHDRIRQLLY